MDVSFRSITRQGATGERGSWHPARRGRGRVAGHGGRLTSTRPRGAGVALLTKDGQDEKVPRVEAAPVVPIRVEKVVAPAVESVAGEVVADVCGRDSARGQDGGRVVRAPVVEEGTGTRGGRGEWRGCARVEARRAWSSRSRCVSNSDASSPSSRRRLSRSFGAQASRRTLGRLPSPSSSYATHPTPHTSLVMDRHPEILSVRREDVDGVRFPMPVDARLTPSSPTSDLSGIGSDE